MKRMDEVWIGIAGIGGMGSNHAAYLSRGDVPTGETDGGLRQSL